MTIAITGASGALGRASAELLLQAVDAREVVLTTRHPQALAEPVARSDGQQVPRHVLGDDGHAEILSPARSRRYFGTASSL